MQNHTDKNPFLPCSGALPLFDFAVHLRRHTGVLCDLFLRKAKFLSLFPHNNAKIHSNFDKNPSYFFIARKGRKISREYILPFCRKRSNVKNFFFFRLGQTVFRSVLTFNERNRLDGSSGFCTQAVFMNLKAGGCFFYTFRPSVKRACMERRERIPVVPFFDLISFFTCVVKSEARCLQM